MLFVKCQLVVFLALFSSVTVFAEQWESLGVFEGDGATVSWKSPQAPNTRVQPRIKDSRAGVRLVSPLATVVDRCFWEVDCPLDLSGTSEIRLSVRASSPDAVERCSLHFRSGDGWYGGWFALAGPGWQTVRLKRSEFEAEGAAAGWDSIQGVRFSVWKGASKNTIISVAALDGIRSAIVVLRNSHAFTVRPNEKPAIERAAQRVQFWFERNGVNTGLLDDSDVADGLPSSCLLAILPNNPCLPATTVAVLRKFVDRGGKIMVSYLVPKELMPLLGLKGLQWAATGKEAQFSTIRFSADSDHGLPTTIRQNSWNANIPEVDGALVLGRWENAGGGGVGAPAVTINSNGVFVGHVLTPVDRDRKGQLLLGLAAMLQPELKASLVAGVLSESENLLSAEPWSETRELLLAVGLQHGHQLSAIVHVAALDDYRDAMLALDDSTSFGDLISRAGGLRELSQEAYFHLVSNRGISNEFRAVWCHDAQGIPGRTWNDSVAALREAGFNALMPNMLWAGAAYYPSEVVPVVAQNGTDLLSECLQACQKYDMKLHLWKVCWNLARAPDAFVEAMSQAGRLQQNSDGSQISYLCPSDPRNRDMELGAIQDAVSRYAVDGIHLDYIRYLNAESCYCEGCRDRFVAASGLPITNWPSEVLGAPHRAAFQDWRREQITTFVESVSSEVRKLRKGVAVSAAVFPSWPSCRDELGQDWVTWVKRGYLDFVCPMNYFRDDAEALEFFQKQEVSVGGAAVPVYPGVGPSTLSLPPEQVIHQIDLVRSAGAKGFVLFELDKDLVDAHLPALRQGATAE
jgi:uncharacterized lipoprotein YddW (UPF0748 family)